MTCEGSGLQALVTLTGTAVQLISLEDFRTATMQQVTAVHR